MTHETYLRVRYAETDRMGYCYYGNYPQYYEVGRTELIRSIGLTYRQMEEEYGVLLPVMSLNIRYIRPARYDDELRLVTSLRNMPERTAIFHTDIYNDSGDLLNGGMVKLGFIRSKEYTSCTLPDFLHQKLSPYFETSQG